MATEISLGDQHEDQQVEFDLTLLYQSLCTSLKGFVLSFFLIKHLVAARDGNSRTKDVSVDWPNCYNCDKPVFYDESLGFFIYCSPACRDEHALPEYDEKLRQDIRELRIPQKMESHTVILETSPKQSSGFFFLKNLEKKQVVITGAYTETAIDLLKKGSIRPHDAVIKINEENIKEVEEIDHIVKPRTIITIIVARDPAFNINLSKFFDRGQSFRKVVFIRHSYDEYELDLKGNKLQIKKDSMAYKSGLRDNEYLQYFATTTDTGVQDVYTYDAYFGTIFTQVLRESKSRGLNLILAVD